jgi:protein O-GlcNAc transferase
MPNIQQAAALLAAGRLAEARALAATIAGVLPRAPAPHAVLARVAEAEGDPGAALNAWLEAASRAGADPGPWREMGRLALGLGRLPEAEMALAQAVQRAPRHAPSRRALAAALAQAGRPADAVPHLLAAASLGDPPSTLVEAGDLSWQAGRMREAVATWALATERAPDLAVAWAKLARGRHALGLADAAADAASEAARRAPSAAHHRLAGLLARSAGRIAPARAALDAALAITPDDPIATWALAACVPAVCGSAHEERAALERHDADLARVAALLERRPTDPRWPDALQTAFPAHYLADDHSERQALHGRVVTGASAVVPTPSPAPRAASGDPRVHVVVVSAYLRDHTVHKLFTGWLRDLDRTRFRVTALACPSRVDAQTRVAADAVDELRRLPADLAGALQAVADARPDVLLFPELGMDPQVLRIAAHRLAPVQAVAWGHPIPSGLPTIDLFLSSEAMEPGPAWTQARRVDLPGVGLHLTPLAPGPAPDRSTWGLPEDRPLLLCVQTLAKYRAWTDDLHARIAAGAPEALLVFVRDVREPVTAGFEARLGRAFRARGLTMDQHVQLLPRQDAAGWRGLLQAGDLFLDSPGWSGGNTTLEAVALGLPVLAFPGTTMRGRHSLGIMRELGLGAELSPPTADAWVERAVALARDAEARATLHQRVVAAAPAFFGDRRGVPRLETALLDALSRRRS